MYSMCACAFVCVHLAHFQQYLYGQSCLVGATIYLSFTVQRTEEGIIGPMEPPATPQSVTPLGKVLRDKAGGTYVHQVHAESFTFYLCHWNIRIKSVATISLHVFAYSMAVQL